MFVGIGSDTPDRKRSSITGIPILEMVKESSTVNKMQQIFLKLIGKSYDVIVTSGGPFCTITTVAFQ